MERFKKLDTPVRDPELYWPLYQDYIEGVIQNTPSRMNLRQIGPYLWGRSFALQLEGDLSRSFSKEVSPDAQKPDLWTQEFQNHTYISVEWQPETFCDYKRRYRP
jgi:hypothetical protein